MRCLLDKVTARHIVQGLLKLAEQRDLEQNERTALDLFSLAQRQDIQFFVVPQTVNVLDRLVELPHYSAIIQLFLRQTNVILPARYFKRWARRLRDYGFTREDAAVLALGTFGTNEAKRLLGVNVIATFDQAMLNQWFLKQSAILERLDAMRDNLSAPYDQAKLPQVLHPQHIDIR